MGLRLAEAAEIGDPHAGPPREELGCVLGPLALLADLIGGTDG